VTRKKRDLLFSSHRADQPPPPPQWRWGDGPALRRSAIASDSPRYVVPSGGGTRTHTIGMSAWEVCGVRVWDPTIPSRLDGLSRGTQGFQTGDSPKGGGYRYLLGGQSTTGRAPPRTAKHQVRIPAHGEVNGELCAPKGGGLPFFRTSPPPWPHHPFFIFMSGAIKTSRLRTGSYCELINLGTDTHVPTPFPKMHSPLNGQGREFPGYLLPHS